MGIGRDIQQMTDKAAQIGLPAKIAVANDDARVEVELREAGPIGVSVDRVVVHQPGMDAAGAKRAGEEIQDRVNYLLEPLRVIESDVESGVTQVRSAEPHCDEAGRHYYEVKAKPGQLELQRFKKPEGSPREAEPMNFTHEQFSRIAEDLAEAACPQRQTR